MSEPSGSGANAACVLALALALGAGCGAPAVTGGVLHVTPRDAAADLVLALARPAALAYEQRRHAHAWTARDLTFGRSLDVGPFAVVAYRNVNILDAGGDAWCWVDRVRQRAGCAELGGLVLAELVRMLGGNSPSDADLGVLVSTLASGSPKQPVGVDRRGDGLHVEFPITLHDERSGTDRRVYESVRLTTAGDVVMATQPRAATDVVGRRAPDPSVVSVEGNRVGPGDVSPETLAPLRARGGELAKCFADEPDDYPIVGVDFVLGAADRVDFLAAWGERVSIDTTACVVAVVRATRFEARADREGRFAISRHAP